MLEFKTDYDSLDDLIYRLTKRAELREQITTRKSVQEQKPDRLSELLKEAAGVINELSDELTSRDIQIHLLKYQLKTKDAYIDYLRSRLDNAGIGYAK